MKKKVFIWLILTCIVLWCILFEIFVLKNVDKDFLGDSRQTETFSHLKDIFELTPGLQNHLILIDKTLLALHHQMMSKNDHTNTKCLFCNVKRHQPISFAILHPANASIEEHIILPILKAWEIGFWVENIISSRPRKSFPYSENLPLGFILQKGGGSFMMEIVLLHEREGDFWWHGSYYQDPQFKLKLKNLKIFTSQDDLILTHEGALEKFHFDSVMIDKIRINVPKNIPLFLQDSSEFKECDHELADRYYRTYGKDTTSRALKFVHKVQKTLAIAKAVLDQFHIPFWISSGTLLGYYRQCGVIPYAQDVDIGIFIRNYNASIIDEFQSRNMKLKHRFGRVSDGLELSFVLNHLKLDIFFFYEDGQSYWNGGHSIMYKEGKIFSATKFRYTFPKFTLCWTEFLDMKIRIPCQIDDYIRANYGPDWFKPSRKWHWNQSPFNVRQVGVWSPDEIEEVIQVFQT